MTKLNKIGKSTFVIAILSFLLVAVLAFGGTYAYFSAKAQGTEATITTGTLTLTVAESKTGITLTSDASLVPNQTLPVSFGELTIAGTTYSALRIRVEVKDENIKIPSTSTATKEEVKEMITITMNSTDVIAEAKDAAAKKWYFDSAANTYYYSVSVGGPSYSALVSSLLTDMTVKFDATAGNKFQGIELKYNIHVEAVQAEYVDGVTGVTVSPTDGSVTFADMAAVKDCFTKVGTIE